MVYARNKVGVEQFGTMFSIVPSPGLWAPCEIVQFIVATVFVNWQV